MNIHSEKLSSLPLTSRLRVTMVKVNYNQQPGEGTVWFDYFLVTDPTITSTMPLTPSSTSPPITNAVHQSPPVGTIVGSVVGGLSLVLAIVLVLVFYRRRRTTKSVLQQSDDSQSTFWFFNRVIDTMYSSVIPRFRQQVYICSPISAQQC